MNNDLVIWLALWVVSMALVFIIYSKQKIPNAGLVFTYLSMLTLNHWFGALIYTLPWHFTIDYENVSLGFIHSVYGVMAFSFSSAVVAPLILNKFVFPKFQSKEKSYLPDKRLPRIYLLIGVVLYFFLPKSILNLPTIGQLSQTGWNFLIMGICLMCWKEWHAEHGKGRMMLWLLVTALFPLFTMVNQGFMSFGMAALILIALFIAAFYRPKWHILLGGILAIYLGLSVFVTYFKYREELRDVVWEEGEKSFSARIQPIVTMVENFELLDLSNNEHLEKIDGRLNQNTLVGASINYLESGQTNFAHGSTILDSVMMLVPRAIWQEKPMRAGSGNLVTDYTGIKFADETSISVGVGPVMEFYINFGTVGILIGFIIIGFVTAWFDIAAGRSLNRGDWQGFGFWFVSGIGCTNNTGSLLEVTGPVIFSITVCSLINKFLLPKFQGKLVHTKQT